jgi:hypothetical protein
MRFCHLCVEEILARVMVAALRAEFPSGVAAGDVGGPVVRVEMLQEILSSEVKKARQS